MLQEKISEYQNLHAKVLGGVKPAVTLTDKGRVRIENGDGEKIISQTEFEGLLADLKLRTTRMTGTIDSQFGWLSYWTVHQGIYRVADLAKVGEENNLPESFSGFIKGATDKTAWIKSTQLGAIGVEYQGPTEEGIKGKFYSKNLGGETRAITIEFIDQNEKVVDSYQVATIGREGDNIVADLHPIEDGNIQKELINLIDSMQDDLNDRIGNIDDTRVRQAILNWLENRHRVCVRGSGGVYFIPGREDRVRDEILSVRRWIQDTGLGTFSVVTLRDDGATSLPDFQESAVEEILKEIREISDKADSNSEDLNTRSVNTQLRKMGELKKKIESLEKNLGDIQLRVESEFQVTLSSVRKLSDKVRENQAKATQEPAKKSGTTMDRNKRKV